MTKQELSFIRAYNSSTKTSLLECYRQCSDAKITAFKNCIRKMNSEQGYDHRIISYNANIFTFGYKIRTKNSIYLVVITPTKERTIFLQFVEDLENHI